MAGKRKAAASGPSGPAKKAPAKKAPAKKAAAVGKDGKPVRLNRRGKPKKQRTLGGKVRHGLLYVLVAFIVLLLLGTAAFAFLYNATELPDPNAEFETQTSYVYYNDNKAELGKFAVQNRDAISYEEMPQDIKDAVVAAENRTFWTDNGLDIKGIVRAAFNNASGNSTQGASTITQQYIKVLYLSQERSYTRKLKEAILSLKLQRQTTKKEILEGYLNTIYFGRGAYGIQAAAAAYFNEPASELSLKQAAALASVLNNPSGYDPKNGQSSRKALRERYQYVLDGMAESGNITDAEAQKASKRLPDFPEIASEDSYGGQRGHVLTMVKNELLNLTNAETGQRFTESEVNGGGLRVQTTFTQKAMDAAAEGVEEARPEGFSDKELHVAAASVEPGTGAVRGLFAGQDYLQSQINWAMAGGQAGSTVKPFSLIAALKAGYSLKDTFDGNSPFELDDGTEVVNEQDNDYGSAVNLTTALEESINTAFTDLTVSMPDGPQKILEAMNAVGIPRDKGPGKHDFGFPRFSQGLDPFPSITLGSATISPVNMASAYATIANAGRFAAPYIIESVTGADGKTLYEHSVADRQVIDPENGPDIAADVTYAMQQVVNYGTGTAALALGREAAGKTGTATNGRNEVSSAWFAGFTPQLSTAVMYVRGKGNEQLDGWLPSYFGGTYPAQTWTAIMDKDMDGLDEETFPEPAYVDGEAPDDGHTPTYAPPPPPPPATTRSNDGGGGFTTQSATPSSSPTRRPSSSPTKKPTSSPPPPQSSQPAPSSSAPAPPSVAPSTAPPPSQPTGGAASPAARVAYSWFDLPA